jgi:polyphenol oxidase
MVYNGQMEVYEPSMFFPVKVSSGIELPAGARLTNYWIGKVGEETLAIATADCVPLVFVDPVGHLMAVVHVGWKDLIRRVIIKTCRKLREGGADLSQLKVYGGPSICAACYHDRGFKGYIKYRLFKFRGLARAVSNVQGTYHYDLRKAIERRLLKRGFKEENIELSPVCNFEAGLPSRRRNGPGGSQMYTVISAK